jgi:hypothetical protein
MAQARCLFEHQAAGYLTAEALLPEAAAYAFLPLRSAAHLHLVQAVARDGAAPVELEWDGRTVLRAAIRVTPDSITLAAVAKA